MKKGSYEERRRVCRYCSREFFVRASAVGAFCSKQCKDDSLRTLPRPNPRPCVICQSVFKPSRKRGDARYCSKRCEWLGRGGHAFSASISKASAAKRSLTMRDRGEGRTYRKLMGRHEHRVIAERMLGRPLNPGEIVHHKDGDKRNNTPTNLQVMTQREHMMEHGLALPGVAPAHRPWEHRKRGKTK